MSEAKCGFDDGALGLGSTLLVWYGPTLIVDIGFDPAHKPGSTGVRPKPGMSGLHALVDSGATESCIDSSLAAQLGLPIVDRRKVSGVHGAREVNVHMAQIYIPSLPFTIYGQFSGVDLIAGGQPHHALLGRTFLANFTMTYDGASGTVTLWRPD